MSWMLCLMLLILSASKLDTINQSLSLDELSVTEMETKLEELMEMIQGLLLCLGVSHASIENVLQTMLKYKLASKLIGSGGGGCVLTLLPTLLSTTIIDKVVVELLSWGFKCFNYWNLWERCWDLLWQYLLIFWQFI